MTTADTGRECAGGSGKSVVRRLLTAADLPVLVRFERQYMADFEPSSLAAWTATIDRNLELWITCMPTSVALVAPDGALVGVALWRVDGAVATLVSVHVDRTRRRSGFGSVLVEAFVAGARQAGSTTAALGVHRDNPGAERLYVARGFIRTGTDGDYRLFERDLSRRT